MKPGEKVSRDPKEIKQTDPKVGIELPFSIHLGYDDTYFFGGKMPLDADLEVNLQFIKNRIRAGAIDLNTGKKYGDYDLIKNYLNTKGYIRIGEKDVRGGNR